MRNRTLLTLVAAGALALITGFIPFAQAQQNAIVQGQVTIEALNCGLQVASASSSIDYGLLFNNEESGEHEVGITNNGNTQGAISVSGSEWSAGGLVTMNTGDTHYGDQGTAYDGKTALSPFDTSIGNLADQDSYFTHFQLKPSLLQVGFTGGATQQVTYSIFC